MGQYDKEVPQEESYRSVNSDTTTVPRTSTPTLEQPPTQLGQEVPVQVQQQQQDQQQQEPEHVKEGGDWTQDKNEFGQVIYHDSEAAAQTRQGVLEPLNKWENYRIHQHEGDGYVVEMQGERTVANFIELVKLVEAAYPDRSTNDIIGSIRGTFSNNNNFREMMDKQNLAPPIEPVEGILTQEDIDKLRSMITHGEDEDGEETGVVKDALGNYVAMGHVITGTEAGINRKEEVSFVDKVGYFDVNTEMDNLYASTITGDLGQSAVLINSDTGHEDNSQYIGEGTEATQAEMVGDIDGFNMGAKYGTEGDRDIETPFSELLMSYFRAVYEDENANRYDSFSTSSGVDEQAFEDQVVEFASNYKHAIDGKVMGLFSATEEEAKEATKQFRAWLKNQQNDTDNNSVETDQDIVTIQESGGGKVYVVSDPSQWQNTGYGSAADFSANKDLIIDQIVTGPPLLGGVQAVILEEGNNKTFNEVVNDEYRWVKVHIVSGASEGTTGWVSNRFVNRTGN
ncbi:MAG: hypothetical protein ACRBFS_26905 [Aureispira sp.]